MRHLLPALLLPAIAAGFLAGCASVPRGSGGSVAATAAGAATLSEPAADVPARIAESTPDRDGTPPSADVSTGEADAAANTDEPGGEADAAEAAEEPAAAARPLDQALAWAIEGLRAYDAGDLETARRKLNDARILLLAAELPAAMEERGIALFDCCLPPDLAHYDLGDVDRRLASQPYEAPEQEFVARELRRILTRFGSAPSDRTFDALLHEVETYIDFYRGGYREFFERAYQRKHKYWPTIEATFAEYRLPTELGYIALVESGFNPRARSRAAARGLWQFIASTGRRYGLRRTEDFYDVARSTRAAAEYLRDLLSIFGPQSFLLATAAYNAGEQRVMGCLRAVDDPFEGRSFWEIRPCFAPETREYVPRILAAAVIGGDPRRFGFDLDGAAEVLARHDLVVVAEPTSLARIARLAGTTAGELRAANSDLASTATATPVRNFPLYLPLGSGARVATALGGGTPTPAAGALAEPGRIAAATDGDAADGARAAETYVVRRGDTLSGIAARYGLSYRQLAAWNGLRSPYRLAAGQRLAIHPGAGFGDGDGHRVVYTVKPGNTLVAIAAIFSVRYADIMSWNALGSSRLRTGQSLVIHPPQPYDGRTYRVRRGDTVGTIARRHGVPVDAVLAANGLGPRTPIHPGQRLLVYVPR